MSTQPSHRTHFHKILESTLSLCEWLMHMTTHSWSSKVQLSTPWQSQFVHQRLYSASYLTKKKKSFFIFPKAFTMEANDMFIVSLVWSFAAEPEEKSQQMTNVSTSTFRVSTNHHFLKQSVFLHISEFLFLKLSYLPILRPLWCLHMDKPRSSLSQAADSFPSVLTFRVIHRQCP